MHKIKKLAIAGAASAIMLSSFAGVALAAPSDCGAAHGAFANVNGNFGFLGALGGTPGYHNGATGQEAGATGYNNSHVDCNPQN
jgi:hypothetical protein